jgi:hypothetical protein
MSKTTESCMRMSCTVRWSMHESLYMNTHIFLGSIYISRGGRTGPGLAPLQYMYTALRRMPTHGVALSRARAGSARLR